ncbi:oxidoreductasealdo/keto reductase family protein [Aphelenchoides avenae]|nr:oxidoreductasealdo/keto reductase family protein [Aphelenchus avenae]
MADAQPRVKLNNGFELPLVGFGTYHTVSESGIGHAVDAALRVGYRLFDTRKKFRNEELLGQALEAALPRYDLSRKDVMISVKCSFDKLTSADKVASLVVDSLERFKTNYLDVFLIDNPLELPANDDTSETLKQQRKEAWQALEKLKGDGVIRSLGVSRYETYHLEEIKAFGGSMPAVNQVEFHPHARRPALRKYCEDNGIFIQAHSSLGQRSDELFSDKEINRLATKHHVNPRTIVLSYATSQGIGVIPRSVNAKRVEQNFNCFKLKLTPDEIKELESYDKEHYKPPNADWIVKD